MHDRLCFAHKMSSPKKPYSFPLKVWGHPRLGGPQISELLSVAFFDLPQVSSTCRWLKLTLPKRYMIKFIIFSKLILQSQYHYLGFEFCKILKIAHFAQMWCAHFRLLIVLIPLGSDAFALQQSDSSQLYSFNRQYWVFTHFE